MSATWERRIAVAGIILGALAFWLTLPPLKVRAFEFGIFLGLLAVVCGIFAATRGERRLGWGAAAGGGRRRAERRRKRRPGGDAADRRVLRHLGRREVGPLVGRAARRDGGGRGDGADP